ncbi:MAG: helix-turn-helix transcriptional regulator [Acidaminococcaceae bacterium]|jgi:transcriptional regulator with XRE-family HTH domain|nr:helix-turn-helix transcriptional regulator [Acidaminococcaceae bacterium]
MKIELEEYKDLSTSQILRLLREDNGYTQWEVASGTHLNRGTYNNYELGKRQPDLDTLKTIADFYQVPPAIFFGRSIPAFIQGIKAPILKKIIPGTPMDAQDNIDGYTGFNKKRPHAYLDSKISLIKDISVGPKGIRMDLLCVIYFPGFNF